MQHMGAEVHDPTNPFQDRNELSGGKSATDGGAPPKVVVVAEFDLPQVNRKHFVWQPVTDVDGVKMRLAPLDWLPSGAHEAIQHLVDEVQYLRGVVREGYPQRSIEAGRLCLSCGKTFPASVPRGTSPEGCLSPAACTLDMTLEEAVEYWRSMAHRKHLVISELVRALTLADHARALLAGVPNPIFDNLKPKLMGEFEFEINDRDEEGDAISRCVCVPWDTIKDVVAAALHAIAEGGK
jgi:hypothetical protein